MVKKPTATYNKQYGTYRLRSVKWLWQISGCLRSVGSC